MKNIELSIIIISYNTKDLLENAIKSIFNNTKNVKYEIIVVDNNSSDGSINMIKNKYSSIKLIANKQNLGFGKACNQAAEIARGEYLFLFNSDCVLIENSLFELLNFIKNNKKAKVVGGKLIDGEFDAVHSYGLIPNYIELILMVIPGLGKYLMPKQNREINAGETFKETPFVVPMVIGADLLISKNDFINHNGFDERFFMYFEEMDLQKRLLNNKGSQAYIIPDVIIKHYERGSSQGNSFFTKLNFYKSMFKYVNKHYNLVQSSFFTLVYLLSFIIKFLFNKKPYNLTFLRKIYFFVFKELKSATVIKK